MFEDLKGVEGVKWGKKDEGVKWVIMCVREGERRSRSLTQFQCNALVIDFLLHDIQNA